MKQFYMLAAFVFTLFVGNVFSQAIEEDWTKQFVSDEYGFRAYFPVPPSQFRQDNDGVTFTAKTPESEYSIQILKFSKAALAQLPREAIMEGFENAIILSGAFLIDRQTSPAFQRDSTFWLKNQKGYQIINHFLFWENRNEYSRMFIVKTVINQPLKPTKISFEGQKASYFKESVSLYDNPDDELDPAPSRPLIIGKIANGVYTNERFKISLTLPNWFFLDGLKRVAISESFKEIKQVKGIQGNFGAEFLLTFTHQPVSNSFLGIIRHNGDFRDLQSLRKFSEKLKQQDLSNPIIKSRLVKDIAEITIGENKTLMFETVMKSASGKTWHTNYLIKVDDFNYFEINCVFDSENNRRVIEETMKSLRIRK